MGATSEGPGARIRRKVPFRPNPDLVANIDGNKRVLRADREAIRKMLEEAIAADRAAGLLDEPVEPADPEDPAAS